LGLNLSWAGTTITVLAYVSGRRMDAVFQDVKALLAPFNQALFYGRLGSLRMPPRRLKTGVRQARNTQKIGRKNLSFRMRAKRLIRRTICFSKLEWMHDIVIGLLINKVEIGCDIHAQSQI
jgi:insertion element IS1 protein InsB